MAPNKDKNNLIADKVIDELSTVGKKTKSSPLSTQVKVKRHYSARRSFDTTHKMRILLEYDACENAVARGTLLRREGIYHSRILSE